MIIMGSKPELSPSFQKKPQTRKTRETMAPVPKREPPVRKNRLLEKIAHSPYARLWKWKENLPRQTEGPVYAGEHTNITNKAGIFDKKFVLFVWCYPHSG
jgi:hypothetical protein